MITSSKQRGFTLIELMIVVAIIGILAAIAYPSYRDSVMKSRRADAQAILSTASLAQERFFASNGRYAVLLSSVGVAGGQSDAGHYTVAMADTPDAYTITAAATGSQAGDVGCATLTWMKQGSKTQVETEAPQQQCVGGDNKGAAANRD